MKTLLSIDDDEIFQFGLSRMVQLHQIQLNLVQTTIGEEGLEMITQLKPDIVLLDLNMPDIDGWNVLDNLNGPMTQNIKVIVLSSSIDPNDKTRSLAYSNVRSYWSKPLEPEWLKSLE